MEILNATMISDFPLPRDSRRVARITILVHLALTTLDIQIPKRFGVWGMFGV